MKGNILISKIVANSSETGWSQAYSTLNLYIALSLAIEASEKPIASLGKDTLEKLQREFFVIDNKTLDTVRQAVQNVVDTLGEARYSIVLATIAKDSLYIIIAGKGSVNIKRGEKVGTIAEGEEGKVTAFSGPLTPRDIFVIETQGFSEKINLDKISPLLSDPDITSISEGLAPLVHEDSAGTEAAILIQYLSGNTEDEKEDEALEEKVEEKTPKAQEQETPFPESKKKFALPSFPNIHLSIPTFNLKFRKTYIIVLLIVVLVGVFIFALQSEGARKKSAVQDKVLNELLTTSQKKYSDGESLESLNKNLALDAYLQSRDILEKGKARLTKGSKQEETLQRELAKVNKKIEELGGGGSATEKKFFDKSVGLVTTKTGVAALNSDGSLYLLSDAGEVTKTVDTKVTNPISLSSDDNNVYILTSDSIYKVDRTSGKTQKISSDTSSSSSIDNFIGNVYTLSPSTSDVFKYSGADFTKSSYFPEKVTFSKKPIWFTIDGSVWIILNDGSIKKYTRGKEDTFQVKNLPKQLGKKLQIYTSSDIDSVYILDIANARIVALTKTGDFQKAYALSKIPSSFSIDSTGKKAYVVSGSTLYSIDL